MKFRACNIPNSMTISEYTKVFRYNDDNYYKNPKITRRQLQPKTTLVRATNSMNMEHKRSLKQSCELQAIFDAVILK